MNLARHAGVLWRFRAITAAGLLLGIFLAVFASYRITSHGLEARGVSVYTSQSQLLVTQPGFPEGRVVLPAPPVTGSAEDAKPTNPDALAFADPARFLSLADLYSKLIVSDDVLSRIPERPHPAQITASPLPAVSGAAVLPIIQLDVTATSSEGARQLNLHAAEALRRELEVRQSKNDILPDQRVQLTTLNAPSPGVLMSGPSKTASILAFLLCIIGTIAVTHLLESLRSRKTEVEEFDEDSFDWILPSSNGQVAERAAVAGSPDPK